jgi:hypothetical protein
MRRSVGLELKTLELLFFIVCNTIKVPLYEYKVTILPFLKVVSNLIQSDYISRVHHAKIFMRHFRK